MSKSRKKKNKKLGLILLVEVLVFIGLIVGFGWYYVNSKLDQVVDDTVAEEKEQIDVSAAVTDTMADKYKTIALFGLDAREGGDLNKAGTAHSDAIIIASINNETKEVKLASVYRDCFLEIAKDGAGTQKVTHAYILGGPTCSVETLNKNLDLNITDYVSVDFKALTKAIDALGGVTINVKAKELNNLNHNIEEQVRVTGIQSQGVWSEGEQVLNGTQATAYARIRKVGNGDFERTQRQRAVISAMIKKAKESDLATINNVLDEIIPLIATNMTKSDILSLAKNMFDYELGDNIGFPLSNTTPNLGKDKGSVVVPANLISNVEHLHSFLYPEDTEYTPSEEVQRISNAITNETGVGDLFTEDKATEEPTSTNQGN
ncbi:MAG: LCP family protein [Lachnospiraceae bacterium]|nr:LCP family protein [Lachnospiraceae bacterium]